MSERSQHPALDLANAYREGAADPIRTVEDTLELARASPTVFLSINEERARRAASESAARWRAGSPLSALDGVPIAWKDLFDVKGLITTAGADLFRRRAPVERDAALIANAHAAGMICLGKTNLSELAYSGLGLNPHFGTPVNALLEHGARAPGGSSSGAAISVASGVVPISIGTDTAGSIRVPSAFNGLVGYRASQRRYPMRGVTALSSTLDTLGPLAHSVADCAAFDRAVRGNAELTTTQPVRGHRFVIDPELIERYGAESSVARGLDQFADRLRAHGATVETRSLRTLADVHTLIHTRGWIGALEAFDRYRPVLDSDDALRIDPRVRTRLELARTVPKDRLGELLLARTSLLTQFAQELAGATLVAPTTAHVAPLLEPLLADADLFARINLKTLALTMIGSFLDTPAIAMPSGVDAAGLPTSIQLMRAQGDDDVLLAVACSIESLPPSFIA